MDGSSPKSAATDSAATGSTDSAAAPIPLPDLEAQITELAGHLNAATYRWISAETSPLAADLCTRSGNGR